MKPKKTREMAAKSPRESFIVGRDINILVVEDQPEQRELLRMSLESFDFKVGTAVDAVQAVRQAREQYPDLILLDYLLPGGSGWDVVNGLRASQTTRHIPIIVYTVLPESEVRSALGDFFNIHFLAKPANIYTMLAAIYGMLGRRHLDSESRAHW